MPDFHVSSTGEDSSAALHGRSESTRMERLWSKASVSTFSLLGLALAMALTFVLSERYSREYERNVVDDALTSMQYAKNLALGNGLVFNVGERVEGYTNFLWVLFMAPFYALSTALGGDFVRLIIHLNIAIAILNLVLVYAIGRKLWGGNWLATLTALSLCVVDNSYTVWAALGLEGHFLAFWLLLALLLASTDFAHKGIAIGLALAAAHMTRPDAGLFCAFLVAALLGSPALSFARRRLLPGTPKAAESAASEAEPQNPAATSDERRALWAALSSLGTWLVVYAAYFLWRYQYYGWLFPNTYYLKVGSGALDAWSRGFRYVQSFLEERWWVPALGLFGIFARTTLVGRSIIAYLLAHVLYIAYVGGDFFPGHRFFVPQLPLFAIACGLAVQASVQLVDRGRVRVWLDARRSMRTVFALVGFALLLPLLYGLYDVGCRIGPLEGEIRQWHAQLSNNRRFMRWLALNKPSKASLSTGAIGAAGYYANFTRVIDMVGIIDPEVAHRPVSDFGHGQAGHEKWATVEEILAQKPTYIQAGYLQADYWREGYYMDASMRLELDRSYDGIWRRDELADTGKYLEQAAIHFDGARADGWTAQGTAFENWPALPTFEDQILGAAGPHVNTGATGTGDDATGRLTSPKFALLGDKMVLRAGGGFDPERLRVSLWIEGQRVFSETGYDSDTLSRREWPIGAYRGKLATLEIVDDSKADWGHIIVDEIVQWQAAVK